MINRKASAREISDLVHVHVGILVSEIDMYFLYIVRVSREKKPRYQRWVGFARA
jgi:hypothetical protein